MAAPPIRRKNRRFCPTIELARLKSLLFVVVMIRPSRKQLGRTSKNGFSVKVRFRELEGIPDQHQARICPLRDYHLDNIETKENIGIAQQPEPGQATERNPALLLTVHRFQRPAKILPGASLDLHENKRVAPAADEIDLA